MKYQLVLQFAAESLEDYDRLVAVEDSLIEELGNAAKVDGHDFGSGTFNIFILTDDPTTVFGQANAIVTSQRVPNVLRSAYPQNGWRGLRDPLAFNANRVQCSISTTAALATSARRGFK